MVLMRRVHRLPTDGRLLALFSHLNLDRHRSTNDVSDRSSRARGGNGTDTRERSDEPKAGASEHVMWRVGVLEKDVTGAFRCSTRS